MRVTTEAQRQELGALLRARRCGLARTDLGLPKVARGRSTGLRREEVAFLSGVSQTWYTWLEQGRDIRPSRQVLDALARTLRLSPTEHAYALSLAGHAAPASALSAPPLTPPPHLQRLLDHLAGSPAFALAADWGITAWNVSYAALYPHIADVATEDRNLLWLVFTDPYVRQLLPNWNDDSLRFLAEFRAEVGTRLSDPAVAAVVERLQGASPEFRDGWTAHRVEGFSSRERLFYHPRVGDLQLEQHRLIPADHPDLDLVVYTAVDDGHTPGRLTALLSAHQSPRAGDSSPTALPRGRDREQPQRGLSAPPRLTGS